MLYDKNNQENHPLEHYLPRYAAIDPAEAAERCAAGFENGEFSLRFLGCDYKISHPDFAARAASEGYPLLESSAKARLLALRYLLEGRFVPPGGRYLTYREVPWGETYWKAFEGRCIKRLAYSFGRNEQGFMRAMEALHAGRAQTGDFSGAIELLPGLTMQLILWRADDEFDPSSQICFSDNFPFAFNSEDMAVAGDVVIDAIRALSK